MFCSLHRFLFLDLEVYRINFFIYMNTKYIFCTVLCFNNDYTTVNTTPIMMVMCKMTLFYFLICMFLFTLIRNSSKMVTRNRMEVFDLYWPWSHNVMLEVNFLWLFVFCQVEEVLVWEILNIDELLKDFLKILTHFNFCSLFRCS